MAYITHYTFYMLFNDLTIFISNALIYYFSLHLSLASCFDNHLMKALVLLFGEKKFKNNNIAVWRPLLSDKTFKNYYLETANIYYWQICLLLQLSLIKVVPT